MNATRDMKKPLLVKKLRAAIRSGKITGITAKRIPKMRKTAVCRALGIKNTSCHRKYKLVHSTHALRLRAKKAGKKVVGSRSALCKRLGLKVVTMAKLHAMAKRRGIKNTFGMRAFELIALLRRAGVKSLKKACDSKRGYVRRPRRGVKKSGKSRKSAKKH